MQQHKTTRDKMKNQLREEDMYLGCGLDLHNMARSTAKGRVRMESISTSAREGSATSTASMWYTRRTHSCEHKPLTVDTPHKRHSSKRPAKRETPEKEESQAKKTKRKREDERSEKEPKRKPERPGKIVLKDAQRVETKLFKMQNRAR